MNFIRETDPFLRELDAWKKGHGFSNTESLKRLADIWDEFKEIPERKKVIYGTVNSNIPKTDLSCGSCVHDLLTFVWNWRAALEHEVSTYFEGVQVAEIVEPEKLVIKAVKVPSGEEFDMVLDPESVKISFDVPQTFPEVEDNWKQKAFDEFKPQRSYSGFKMHELRSIAKKKGIAYSNKTTSKEIIELLNNKDNG